MPSRKMPWRVFVLYNMAGAVLWPVVITTLGYLFGASLPLLVKLVGRSGTILLIAAIVIGVIAWRVRHTLGLDHMAASGLLAAVPGPASLFAGDAAHPDNIIFDITPNPSGGTGNSASGFGHPTCLNTADPKTLPAVQP